MRILRAVPEVVAYLAIYGLLMLFGAVIFFAAQCHADGATLPVAGRSGGKEVNNLNRATLLLALCAGCAAGGEPGQALVPGSRTPVPVADAAPADQSYEAGIGLADVAPAPDAAPADRVSPDTGAPPDLAPALAACADDVGPLPESACASPAGSCRTATGRVCYVCNTTAPCEWSRNLTQTVGPACALPRICVSASAGCTVMAGGERCTRDRDGGQ